MAEENNLKVNDRVKRKDRSGCLGVVKDVREEVTGSRGEVKDRALIVQVRWDNGTLSFFSPEALERVQ